MGRVNFGGQLRLLLLGLLALLASSTTEDPSVRVLFLTDCSPYSDWQTMAMVYSYMYSGHKGPITRVMCCSEEDRATYNQEMLGLVETHIAASFAVNPGDKDDYYVAYNKPGAVIDYLEHVTPEEEWLLVLDSDMIIRNPWKVQEFNLSLGWAVGSDYGYLVGVSNDLADRHIPEIPKRNDSFAGPVGRRSDMVGGFFFIHRTDLKRLSKLWLKYTFDVRQDPEAYHLTGDAYAVKPGMKPWIAEMYGYSFGAAKANIWHHWDEPSMLYPGYVPSGIPKVLHYGLEWDVQGYQYDKHWYWLFDPFKCPPWDLTPQRPKEGIFPHPPRPSNLTAKNFGERYRDLISVEGVATLNAGMCFWYRHRCPSSPQLEQECDKAEAIFFETREALRIAEANYDCIERQSCVVEEVLEKLSNPKVVVMKPQPVTGASAQFSLDPPGTPTATTTTATPFKARVPTTEEPEEDATPADVPVTVTTGDPDAAPFGTSEEPEQVAADEAAAASPAEAAEEVPKDDTPAVKFIQTDTPTPAALPAEASPAPAPKAATPTPTTASEGAKQRQADSKAEEERKANRKLVHHLLKRCYHLASASIDEVKECMAQAKLGERWKQKATPAKAHAAGGGDGTAVKADKATPVEAAAQPTTAHPATDPHIPLSASTNGFGYQMVVVWGLLAAALYAVPSFLVRRRRRIARADARRGPRHVSAD